MNINFCFLKQTAKVGNRFVMYSPRWGQYPQLPKVCYIYCELSHTSCDSKVVEKKWIWIRTLNKHNQSSEESRGCTPQWHLLSAWICNELRTNKCSFSWICNELRANKCSFCIIFVHQKQYSRQRGSQKIIQTCSKKFNYKKVLNIFLLTSS